MKERPILFNDEMVRALLDGRKSQTRRIIKPQPAHVGSAYHFKKGKYPITERQFCEYLANNRCPYGHPGDRLWVREAWGLSGSQADVRLAEYRDPEAMLRPYLLHRADADGYDAAAQHWRPSIHMPHWACRLLLEVTAVRVERLHDIGDSDAAMEGVEEQGYDWIDYLHRDEAHVALSARVSFATLWDSINGRGSWDANPWVWVVEFKRIEEGQS